MKKSSEMFEMVLNLPWGLIIRRSKHLALPAQAAAVDTKSNSTGTGCGTNPLCPGCGVISAEILLLHRGTGGLLPFAGGMDFRGLSRLLERKRIVTCMCFCAPEITNGFTPLPVLLTNVVIELRYVFNWLEISEVWILPFQLQRRADYRKELP